MPKLRPIQTVMILTLANATMVTDADDYDHVIIHSAQHPASVRGVVCNTRLTLSITPRRAPALTVGNKGI